MHKRGLQNLINMHKVKQLMKEKGLKVQFVCDKLGASRYKLYDWERGKSTPTESEIRKLAALLDTSAEYLTDRTDVSEQKGKLSASAESLPEIEREILDIYRSLSEEKKQAFMTVARSLGSRSADK